LSRFLRICNQSFKKVPIWQKKKKKFEKIEKGVKKRRISRWFRIRWKSFEKNYQKKVISKNVMEKCTFFTFTHVRQTCFAYNLFLVLLFTTFSTDSKSAWNSAFFDTFFYLKIFFFCRSYWYFFQTLKPNAQKTVQKIKKRI
jgi:hypothetical protein